ncbi:MAG: hypothetical protein RSD97_07870 [Lachnospiraceae bacterium]
MRQLIDNKTNKVLKNELKEIYAVPKPIRKQQFMSCIDSPKISISEFVLGQIGYIRKSIWIIALLLFGVLLFCLNKSANITFGIFSAMIPIYSLLMVMESSRSFQYGMEELELSSRFSLKAVVLARLCVLGMMNFFVLLILCPLFWQHYYAEQFYYGIYILVPYLMTCFLDLFVIRKIRGKEGVYSCIAITILISVTMLVFFTMQVPVHKIFGAAGWVTVIVFLVILNGREGFQLFKQTEEYTWNLQ